MARGVKATNCRTLAICILTKATDQALVDVTKAL